jgi:dihydroorotase
MDVILASALIHDPDGPYDGQRRHVWLQNGQIKAVFEGELPEGIAPIRAADLHVSVGWLDLNCTIGDPGLEAKEDFASAAQAATRGGFTDVLVMPDAVPLTQTRAAVTYVRQRTMGLPVHFYPLAAVTVDAAGTDLTEMRDLLEAGAVGFSDGPMHPLQRAEVLVRALQYAAPLGSVILNRAEHRGLSEGGQMHESEASVRLGLRGLPALAEDLQLARDLQLLAYAGGRLHVLSVSTAKAVAMIREAKAQGLAVTADVAAHQVAFTADEVPAFNTSYKVRPPFRAAEDVQALLEGLLDGTIDAITSAHQPHDTEAKELEFDLAEFGATGLETAFAVINTYAGEKLGLATILQRLTTGPRAVLGWPVPHLEEGAKVRLTFFDPSAEWTPTPETTLSKSRNNPFYGQRLRGKVIGIA